MLFISCAILVLVFIFCNLMLEALHIDGSASPPLDPLLTMIRISRRFSLKPINAGGLIHHGVVEASRAGKYYHFFTEFVKKRRGFGS